ncbi:MAG: PspC domain-containing protein [Elusimicrobia bacterium RIFOXYB2_FULL_50_12]|nr:MAG: PspC domain-containing protein [Elusimicrobia bacterium RIFOXYB2_FULL_50_12]
MKRLYRSRADRKIAGICGGLGEYLGVDPVLIRFLFVLVCILTGVAPMILVYLAGWLIIPESHE